MKTRHLHQGYSSIMASMLKAFFAMGTTVGSLIGGLLNEFVAQRWSRHGTIFLAQVVLHLIEFNVRGHVLRDRFTCRCRSLPEFQSAITYSK